MGLSWFSLPGEAAGSPSSSLASASVFVTIIIFPDTPYFSVCGEGILSVGFPHETCTPE